MIRRAWFALALAVAACQHGPPPVAEDASDVDTQGQVHRFVLGTVDGQELSAESMHGRVTALVFVTTFDLASQVAAKRLNQVLHTHRPRINAFAVVLEAPKYAPLAEVFHNALELSYPVALADLGMLERNSTFGEVRSVPTLLVLDREGRERFRKSGAFGVDELNDWLAHAERP